MKVAIIEDNVEFAYLLAEILQTETKHFTDVDYFVDDSYDLVTVDLRLENSYGMPSILKLKEKTDAPIVVITGMGGTLRTGTEDATMLEIGAKEVFSKDMVNSPQFLDRIKAIVARSKEVG